MFDGKYHQLNKSGTFGWTRLTYVGDINAKKEAGPSFGLMAPGYFWIDDVSLEKVGATVPLTEKPVLDREEAPIDPPGDLAAGAVRCPRVRIQERARVESLLRLRSTTRSGRCRGRGASGQADRLV